MSASITVIICTHNPRPAYLRRVLAALKAQTLACADWELILIDNMSSDPVADRFDISWHPAGRHIREEELGLTPARLRGIAEASHGLLVFVDDDNVMEPDYLEQALRIAEKYPFLGAWGASVTGEFDVPPPHWTKPYWHMLAIRQVREAIWTNDYRIHPWGPGLCVRGAVARHYALSVRHNPIRSSLGRRGTGLLACEDIDLVLASADFDLGWGQFPQLKIRHLIPPERLRFSYLFRISRAGAESWNTLLLGRGLAPDLPSSRRKRYVKALFIALRQGLLEALFYLNFQRGLAMALKTHGQATGAR